MIDLNTVCLNGRICRTPEMITKGNENRILKVVIAVNRSQKNKTTGKITNKTIHPLIIIRGNLATKFSRYLTKGRYISVEGYIDERVIPKKNNNLSHNYTVPTILAVRINPFIERQNNKKQNTQNTIEDNDKYEDTFDNAFENDDEDDVFDDSVFDSNDDLELTEDIDFEE